MCCFFREISVSEGLACLKAPGEFIKTQISESHLHIVNSAGLGPLKSAFPISSQVMLILLVLGPHFENHSLTSQLIKSKTKAHERDRLFWTSSGPMTRLSNSADQCRKPACEASLQKPFSSSIKKQNNKLTDIHHGVGDTNLGIVQLRKKVSGNFTEDEFRSWIEIWELERTLTITWSNLLIFTPIKRTWRFRQMTMPGPASWVLLMPDASAAGQFRGRRGFPQPASPAGAVGHLTDVHCVGNE